MIHCTNFRAMGCEVEIKLEADSAGSATLATMPEYFNNLEDHLSRFRPESELTQLNAKAGEWSTVSPILFDNLIEARRAARRTEGRFNPFVLPALVANGYSRSFDELVPAPHQATTPVTDWQAIQLRSKTREVRLPPTSAVDLGGIAKGWTAQHIADDLARIGPNLVNIGGDIAVRGTPAGTSGWRIDIADPETNTDITSVWLNDMAIVTSGTDYRRWVNANGEHYHHIIDPMIGLPASTDVVAVTVIHPYAPTAEAYAKSVLIQGAEPGLHWLNQRPPAAGLVVRQDGAVITTENFIVYMQERKNV